MSKPIRPGDIVGVFTWQKLQQKDTWLNDHQDVSTVWGIRRFIRSLPLLGRLAEPKASQQSINRIKQQLRDRHISETDIKLLLKTANIIKLHYSNGLLTEKPDKAITRERLQRLVSMANRNRGELLNQTAKKSRGAFSRYIENERKEAGIIGSSLPVIPRTPPKPVQLTFNRQPRIPVTRRATTISSRSVTATSAQQPAPANAIPLETQFKRLFLQLQLKDDRLKPEHLQPLIDKGIIHTENLYGNNDRAIKKLTQQACEALGFNQD